MPVEYLDLGARATVRTLCWRTNALRSSPAIFISMTKIACSLPSAVKITAAALSLAEGSRESHHPRVDG